MTPIESVSETMILLMKSTGRFVCRRIPNKAHQDIYVKTMKRCIAAVETDFNNYEVFLSHIESIDQDVDTSFKPRLFNKFSQEREYYHMACHHALDIVTKLNARFITGMADTEPRYYKGTGFYVPKDEGAFE